MNKNDLIYGNIVETRNGELYLTCNNSSFDRIFISLTDYQHYVSINKYNDDLIYFPECGCEYLDIVKVYKDYTLKEVIWERPKKPYLTDDEKAILRSLHKCYTHIGRDDNGYLMIYGDDVSGNGFWCFNHLFMFIKHNEKYLIEDLLKEQEDDD